jgi:hypothetical protein
MSLASITDNFWVDLLGISSVIDAGLCLVICIYHPLSIELLKCYSVALTVSAVMVNVPPAGEIISPPVL